MLSRVTLALTGSVTLSPPDYIQHLDLRLNMVYSQRFFINMKLIESFSGDRIIQKSCKIVIKLPVSGDLPLRLNENRIYQVMEDLIGFKILTLKLEHQNHDPHLLTGLRRESVKYENGLPHSISLGHCERISGFLAVTLGPAESNKSVDEHRLRFWPSVYDA